MRAISGRRRTRQYDISIRRSSNTGDYVARSQNRGDRAGAVRVVPAGRAGHGRYSGDYRERCGRSTEQQRNRSSSLHMSPVWSSPGRTGPMPIISTQPSRSSLRQGPDPAAAIQDQRYRMIAAQSGNVNEWPAIMMLASRGQSREVHRRGPGSGLGTGEPWPVPRRRLQAPWPWRTAPVPRARGPASPPALRRRPVRPCRGQAARWPEPPDHTRAGRGRPHQDHAVGSTYVP